MALPNTISTAIEFPSFAQSYVGPFKSPAGKYYTFARDTLPFTNLVAMSADDPESTWTEEDASGRPIAGSIEAIWCYQVGSDIHIVFSDSSNTTLYSRFDMSSDIWVEIGTGDTEIVIESPPDEPDLQSCTIVVASDGDIYVGYNGDTEKFMGQEKERVYWDKSTDSGVTWAGPTHLRTTSDADGLLNVVAILGISDRIHFFWSKGFTELIHRSLSSGDSLDTEATADSVIGVQNPNIGRGDVYTDNPNKRVRIPYIDQNSKITDNEFTSAQNPTLTIEADASDDTAQISRGLNACIASRNGTNKEAWLAFVRIIDRDLFVDDNPDGAGWGTDTEVNDGVFHVHVSCNVITNEAGDLVLGMIVQDTDLAADPVQYTEHLIQAAPTALGGVEFPPLSSFAGPFEI